jgi:hypothetical protein
MLNTHRISRREVGRAEIVDYQKDGQESREGSIISYH